MRALVVYESMFGNTRSIAEAIGEGLGRHLTVDTVEVGEAGYPPQGVDLLVVGGPTHAFGMSRVNTRESARGSTDEPLISNTIGIREWLDRLHPAPGQAGAAFDTRIDRPRLPSSAAAKAHKRLRRLGVDLVTGPKSFYVDGTTGPLLAGEAERARSWGEELGSKVTHDTRSRVGGR
jgi:hypothetical protein